ncbi:hypothetical protein L0F63_005315 [Massospora cicadina]|nr:hypothetical protein L0F63_005315 [Massospora cicadina]
MLWQLGLLQATVLVAKTIEHQFIVETGTVNPDGTEMPGITINGQFPGPAIEAEMGDRIFVLVVNRLSKNFSMHWHGIRQFGTLRSDGVPGVTQEPIPPGGEYQYDFNVEDQMGTWWYHAHTDLDLIQAFGLLVVRESEPIRKELIAYNPKYYYDDELVMMLSEWWHQSPTDLAAGLTTAPFRYPPNPDAILINGQLSPTFTVEGGKRYRLRIVASNGQGIFSVHIPFHELELIEADGTVLEPIMVKRIVIGSGQRYSAIFDAKKVASNFVISVQSKQANASAILHYSDAPLSLLVTLPHSTQTWMDSSLHTSSWYARNRINHYYSPPITIQTEIILNIRDTEVDGIPKYKINDLIQPPHPHLPATYTTHVGERIQVIIQHFASNNTGCEPHPWHFHGHSFYVVGSGEGLYDPTLHNPRIEAKLKLSPKLPVLRDTLITQVIQPNPASTTCGWYAIRYLADNPGDWLMHCHITPHLIMGKYLVIHEG